MRDTTFNYVQDYELLSFCNIFSQILQFVCAFVSESLPITFYHTTHTVATVTFLLPVHSRRCLWNDEALLQVTEHIIQHPDVGGVTLFRVVCRPHGF